MLLLNTSLIAQRSIDGVVLEQSSEQPLMGVNVIKKNTNEGVTSDFDGKFTLNNVLPGDVYVISYVGFKSKEIIIEDQTSLSILLDEDSALLDEIVVVGYGSQLKSNVVGSVVSVEVDKASQIPTTNVTELLRGRDLLPRR